MNWVVFGVQRDGDIVFIGRGSIAEVPGNVRRHHGTGAVILVRYLSELEALVLEYQLIYDMKPVENSDHPMYSSNVSPMTNPGMLYRKYSVDDPGLRVQVPAYKRQRREDNPLRYAPPIGPVKIIPVPKSPPTHVPHPDAYQRVLSSEEQARIRELQAEIKRRKKRGKETSD